jgi:hypothetical protein
MSVTYTAVLPVSGQTVLFVSGLLHAERRRLATRAGTRKLGCYRQAILVLRWLLHELWRSPDGSRGRQLATPYDNGSCTPGDDSTWNDNRYHVSFRPHAPANIDVKRLRALLVSGAGRDPAKPVDVLAGIAGTYEEDVAEKPVRAAMLRILAEQPGIVAREGATDQLGRTGVLVSLPYVDAQGVTSQHHLLLERSTGLLISAYETITGPLPTSFDPRLGPDAASGIIASHDGTRLYLESRYTDDAAGTAVGCGSHYAGVVRDLSRMLAAPAPSSAAPVAGGRT